MSTSKLLSHDTVLGMNILVIKMRQHLGLKWHKRIFLLTIKFLMIFFIVET